MPHLEDVASIANKSVVSQKTSSIGDDAYANRIRTKNRRKRYLDLHPEYFKQPHLELAGRHTFQISHLRPSIPIHFLDPLLYDRLIRRFQTAEEREKEGRERGYSGVLEANLVRSEAKLQALEHPDPNNPLVYGKASDGSINGVEQDERDRVRSREEGLERWVEVMELRFLRGDDQDFEYQDVDDNEQYDDQGEEERSKLDEYLQGESEEFVGEGKPTGETGIQDF